MVVIGVGGLGHLAIQILHALTPARIVVVATRPERVAFAKSFGADEVVLTGSDGGVSGVLEQTDGVGADAVLDLVGERDVPANSLKMLRKGGAYVIVGYGGEMTVNLLEAINHDYKILASQIGSYTELVELMELAHQGKVRIDSERFPLEDVNDVYQEINAGKILGRAVLIPSH